MEELQVDIEVDDPFTLDPALEYEICRLKPATRHTRSRTDRHRRAAEAPGALDDDFSECSGGYLGNQFRSRTRSGGDGGGCSARRRVAWIEIAPLGGV
jgi:hypothetical protein